MPSEGPIQHRRYQAPTRNGEVFFDPPYDSVPAIVRANQALAASSELSLFGQPLTALAARARSELVSRAENYTRRYSNVPESPAVSALAQTPILMSGHQPQLFHPGVWFKNFVLARLGQSTNAIAVNLIVDNDAAGIAAIRVPGGSVDNPRVETVPYDRPAEDSIPFEERHLLDRALFDSFDARVGEQLGNLVPHSLLKDWWPRVRAIAGTEENLGRCLSQARHEQEIDWGISNLELPLSEAVDTWTFRRFLASLILDLRRFQEVYNRMLREYRRVNRIRSHSHPAPALQAIDGWLEAPFWIWTSDDRRRRRLFVSDGSGPLQLTDRHRFRFSFAASEGANPESLVEQLSDLASRGVKIRPRALMTTMYARLFLCDLFVHGIGGGKYDQLTDAIVREFFHVEPPEFLVATATLHLPIDRPIATAEQQRTVDREIRELKFNPDRHVDLTPETLTLVAAKRELVHAPPNGSRKAWHDAIESANAALQPFVFDRKQRLSFKRERLELLLRYNKILGSREYPFCLYPEDALQALLLDKS